MTFKKTSHIADTWAKAIDDLAIKMNLKKSATIWGGDNRSNFLNTLDKRGYVFRTLTHRSGQATVSATRANANAKSLPFLAS